MAVFSRTGTENHMRWDRVSRRFMEAWYATFNHRDSGYGVWLRYTLTAPARGAPFCELWGFVFDPDGKANFAAKERLPIDRLGVSQRDDGALVRIGEAWLSENHLEGDLERDGRKLSWSLDFEPARECFHHLPARLRGRLERAVSTVCSPNLDVPFSGVVRIDEEELRVADEAGCQSHRWGRRNPHSWAWSHCTNFEEEQALFEGVAARTGFGLLPAPTATFLFLRYRDQDLVFNDELRWALRARSRYEMPTWAFTARNEQWRIVGAARASLDRLIQVTYEDPDGAFRYCANSEIADLAIEIYRRTDAGWRHHGSLTALRTAHLEFGRREPYVELPVAL